MSTHHQGAASGVAACLDRMHAIARRGMASREELAALTGWLGSERKVVQRCAAEALATLGRRQPVVHELLLQCLCDQPVRAQSAALYALALMEQLRASELPILLQVLGSQDADVRWAAVHMLVRMKATPGVVAAVRGLARDGEAVQRKMAAYCLREFGFAAPETDSVLIGRLNDEQPEVRLAAISGLARVACDRALVARELLWLIVRDTNQRVRRAAAVALGELGDSSPEVISGLRQAARGSDASLRRAAERSLGMLRS